MDHKLDIADRAETGWGPGALLCGALSRRMSLDITGGDTDIRLHLSTDRSLSTTRI